MSQSWEQVAQYNRHLFGGGGGLQAESVVRPYWPNPRVEKPRGKNYYRLLGRMTQHPASAALQGAGIPDGAALSSWSCRHAGTALGPSLAQSGGSVGISRGPLGFCKMSQTTPLLLQWQMLVEQV